MNMAVAVVAAAAAAVQNIQVYNQFNPFGFWFLFVFSLYISVPIYFYTKSYAHRVLNAYTNCATHTHTHI